MSNNEQILNNISNLQKIERQLLTDLETNSDLTVEQQDKIFARIQDISEMRVDLYETIGGTNEFYKKSLSNSEETLQEQKAAIIIIEKDLNESKKQLDELKNTRINKLRIIELNSYYSDQYEEKTQFMKVIFFTMVPIVIMAYFLRIGLLPSGIFNAVSMLILFVGAYFGFGYITSMFMRDNMNYQEYDWFFNKDAAPKPVDSDGTDPWAVGSLGTCVGDSCCSDGLSYSTELNQCVVAAVDPLTKGVDPNAKPDVTLGESFQPYSF